MRKECEDRLWPGNRSRKPGAFLLVGQANDMSTGNDEIDITSNEETRGI